MSAAPSVTRLSGQAFFITLTRLWKLLQPQSLAKRAEYLAQLFVLTNNSLWFLPVIAILQQAQAAN